MNNMRLLIWFSCGAASAVACKIALSDSELLSNYEEVVIAYCKVNEEHPDNDRFLKDCERWFGKEILILQNDHYEGSIYKVFETNYMRTPAGSPCTRSLKKQVRQKFQRPTDTHIFGYTIEEQKRANDFEKSNHDLTVEWPLIDHRITKDNCLAMIDRAGIELPEMYKLGYEHNNCVGCVKGGMGYWNKIRVDFPDQFDRMAEFEQRKGYTVLKEQFTENGVKKTRPLYLKDLDPNRGNFKQEPKIECGIQCEMMERKYRALNE